VKQLIGFRKARMLPLEHLDVTLNELIAQHRVEWHGIALGEPDWSDGSHSLAATFHFDGYRMALHLMINAYWEALTFAIPRMDDKHLEWRRCVDTSRPAPEDARGWPDAETVRGETFVVQPRSIVGLITRSNDVSKF
jgi:glycogen operon protein